MYIAFSLLCLYYIMFIRFLLRFCVHSSIFGNHTCLLWITIYIWKFQMSRNYSTPLYFTVCQVCCVIWGCHYGMYESEMRNGVDWHTHHWHLRSIRYPFETSTWGGQCASLYPTLHLHRKIETIWGRGVSVKIHHPDSQKNHNPLPLWEKIRCSGVEV